jgi:branched-subunit amino acid ABC-type transport system permease component
VSDLAPFLVVGVVAGSLYGLAGMGLVLTYQTSGILNFAHGAVAAAGAFAFYDLHFRHGLPWPLALLVSVVGIGVVAGTALERLARRLAGARPVLAVTATIGLLLGLQGLLTARYGLETRTFPTFLPTAGFRLAGVTVTAAQVLTVAIALAAGTGLYAFLRVSALGTAMRAVVDDPALTDLTGWSPARVRRAAWMLGSAFAALSGILLAPTLGLDAFLLTLLVVQAFGPCAVARFASLPVTLAAGVGVGVLSAVVTRVVASHPTLAGLPSTTPFLVLFGVLVLRGRTGALPRAQRVERRAPAFILPRPVRSAGSAGLAALLVAVPFLVGPRLPVYTNGLTLVLVFASLGLLVWTSGQISLCHAAFAAVGASTFAHLTTGAGLPWAVALLLAGLAAVPLGAVVAIPAIRLSGIYLALATFGFGILVERILFGTGFMFGELGRRSATRPDLGPFSPDSDRSFYYAVLIVTALGVLLVVAVTRTRLGRLLRGLGDSPVALATLGVSVNVSLVLAFCLSALLAGVAGALMISASRQASGISSLLWLAVLALSGTRPVGAAVRAAALVAVLPAYLPDVFNRHQALFFGLGAVGAAVLATGRVERIGARSRDRLAVGATRVSAPAPAPAPASAPAPAPAVG